MPKPSKPTPDYPLFAHNNGQWAKKIKGKLCYFGSWSDPEGALARYLNNDAKKSTERQCQAKIKVSSSGRPHKPRKDYPLYPHASGRWAKKVRGETRFFGPWDDPQGALNLWLDQKDDLLAGRKPQLSEEGLTVRSLVNQFLESKEALVENGELTRRHWEDLRLTGIKLAKTFGRSRLVTNLQPADFEKLRKDYSKTHGATTLTNDIGRVRTFFNWAYKQGLLDRPVVFGEGFQKPSRRIMRRERNKKGPKMFTARQIHTMLAKTNPQLRAMILLGINCGLGNHDCATLPLAALNLQSGWLTYPRPKTEIDRRCKLWPETIKALQAVLTRRHAATLPNVFITKYGYPWTSKARTGDSPITKETAKLLKNLKIHRPGLGFYALRHTFETIAGESRDQAAVDHIMGHAPDKNDMSAVYRERMTDQRLFRVAKYVRQWLRHTPSQKSSQPVSA